MTPVEQSIVIEAPLGDVGAVITDYERYPAFLSDLRSARVLRRDGPAAHVAFVLHVLKPIHYTLRLMEDLPHRVTWTQEEGAFLRNDGGWALEDLGGGRTRATYSLDLALGLLLPGAVLHRLTHETLPATLAAFKAEAETLSRP